MYNYEIIGIKFFCFSNPVSHSPFYPENLTFQGI